jgi:hypothetical protein
MGVAGAKVFQLVFQQLLKEVSQDTNPVLLPETETIHCQMLLIIIAGL